jgi:plastocyanin
MRRLLILLAVVAVAGCGDDTSSSKPTPAPATPTPAETATTDSLTPPPEETATAVTRAYIGTGRGEDLSFSQDTVDIEAGRLTFALTNRGSLEHAIAIRGRGVNVQGALVEKGEVSRIEIALKPGTYRFYCPVPGHADGGMTGKLVVR